MQPDPTNLLNLLEISNTLIGFYDTPEKHPFEQLCRLDDSSFLYKSFWPNVKQSRQN